MRFQEYSSLAVSGFSELTNGKLICYQEDGLIYIVDIVNSKRPHYRSPGQTPTILTSGVLNNSGFKLSAVQARFGLILAAGFRNTEIPACKLWLLNSQVQVLFETEHFEVQGPIHAIHMMIINGVRVGVLIDYKGNLKFFSIYNTSSTDYNRR